MGARLLQPSHCWAPRRQTPPQGTVRLAPTLCPDVTTARLSVRAILPLQLPEAFHPQPSPFAKSFGIVVVLLELREVREKELPNGKGERQDGRIHLTERMAEARDGIERTAPRGSRVPDKRHSSPAKK